MQRKPPVGPKKQQNYSAESNGTHAERSTGCIKLLTKVRKRVGERERERERERKRGRGRGREGERESERERENMET